MTILRPGIIDAGREFSFIVIFDKLDAKYLPGFAVYVDHSIKNVGVPGILEELLFARYSGHFPTTSEQHFI